jgi:hypothetical protein
MLTNDMIMDVSEQREVRGDPRYHQYLAQCEREREERDAALDDNY